VSDHPYMYMLNHQWKNNQPVTSVQPCRTLAYTKCRISQSFATHVYWAVVL